MEPENLIKILQASIAPCVLISGLGLLLLTMTNRLGRTIDRTRQLNDELGSKSQAVLPHVGEQIAILYKRCRYLRTAIALNTFSIFLTSIIIFLVFEELMFRLGLESTIATLFVVCLISLIISLMYFLLDVFVSLNSLKIEINRP